MNQGPTREGPLFIGSAHVCISEHMDFESWKEDEPLDNLNQFDDQFVLTGALSLRRMRYYLVLILHLVCINKQRRQSQALYKGCTGFDITCTNKVSSGLIR